MLILSYDIHVRVGGISVRFIAHTYICSVGHGVVVDAQAAPQGHVQGRAEISQGHSVVAIGHALRRVRGVIGLTGGGRNAMCCCKFRVLSQEAEDV